MLLWKFTGTIGSGSVSEMLDVLRFYQECVIFGFGLVVVLFLSCVIGCKFYDFSLPSMRKDHNSSSTFSCCQMASHLLRLIALLLVDWSPGWTLVRLLAIHCQIYNFCIPFKITILILSLFYEISGISLYITFCHFDESLFLIITKGVWTDITFCYEIEGFCKGFIWHTN